jgi:predicted site-specific integrase-resolvase
MAIKELLTEKEAAEFLGIARGTLANYRSAGKGPPYVKIEGTIRYRKADLEAYIEAHRVDPSQGERE